MHVLETLLRYDYFWTKIRVQGGAYGAGHTAVVVYLVQQQHLTLGICATQFLGLIVYYLLYALLFEC